MATKGIRTSEENVITNPEEKFFHHPGHHKEVEYRRINEKDKVIRQEEYDYMLEEFTEKQYVVMTREQVDKIAGIYYKEESKGILRKAAVFFIWKYSQLLVKTNNEEHRELLLESITHDQEREIMAFIRKQGLMKHTSIVGLTGKVERTKKSQIRLYEDDLSDYEWIKNHNGVGYHPKLRPFDLFDLSIETLEAVMTHLGFSVKTFSKLKEMKTKALNAEKARVEKIKQDAKQKEKDILRKELLAEIAEEKKANKK